MSQRIIIDRLFEDIEDRHTFSDDEVVLIHAEKDDGETYIQFSLDLQEVPTKTTQVKLSINKTDLLVALAAQ